MLNFANFSVVEHAYIRRVTILTDPIRITLFERDLCWVQFDWHAARCRTDLRNIILVMNHLLLDEPIHCSLIFAKLINNGVDHTVEMPVEICELIKSVPVSHR